MNDFINDFSEDLEFSYTIEGGLFYTEVYKRAFPEFKHMSSNKGDSQMQRHGIDRTVVLKSGKAIYIDEKNRRPKCCGRLSVLLSTTLIRTLVCLRIA